jgi:hypothetical protein
LGGKFLRAINNITKYGYQGNRAKYKIRYRDKRTRSKKHERSDQSGSLVTKVEKTIESAVQQSETATQALYLPVFSETNIDECKLSKSKKGIKADDFDRVPAPISPQPRTSLGPIETPRSIRLPEKSMQTETDE